MHEERRDPRPPAVRDVAARGARIRFVDAGRGAPLVLVHDYLASHVTWDDVLAPLSRRFRVIAPDLPGFGESEKPPPGRYRYDFEAFSESLVDLVAAVGQLHLVGADMVKPGSTVIDVGMNRTDEGLFGDVDPGAKKRAAYMTPVPGGVGPMTIAMVLKNTVTAARARRGLVSGVS